MIWDQELNRRGRFLIPRSPSQVERGARVHDGSGEGERERERESERERERKGRVFTATQGLEDVDGEFEEGWD